MRTHRNMLQTKEQHIISEKALNKVEVISPANREFKTKIIKMLTELRRRKDKHSENL